VASESLPKRHYTKGARKLVGFRLPDELKKKLETLAGDLGWTVTDVAQTALDQYVFGELAKPKGSKKEGSKGQG
jgi:predicted transcriptional regulator